MAVTELNYNMPKQVQDRFNPYDDNGGFVFLVNVRFHDELNFYFFFFDVVYETLGVL